MVLAPLAPQESEGTGPADVGEAVDERRPLVDLFRDLRTSRAGLSGREAARRQLVYGPNTLTRHHGRRWPRELLSQFTQPLAILLALAAVEAANGLAGANVNILNGADGLSEMAAGLVSQGLTILDSVKRNLNGTDFSDTPPPPLREPTGA